MILPDGREELVAQFFLKGMFLFKAFSRFGWLAIAGIFFIGIGTSVRADPVIAGSSVTLSVTADGTSPFAYQWQKDGADISGATAAKYTITNVQNAAAGNYAVVVSNSAGSVTSSPATLTVQAASNAIAPTITTQPVSLTLSVGGSASFKVVAGGSPAPTYQWQKGGVNIGGATGGTLVLNNVQSSDAGNYAVVVSNSAGSVTSSAATLTTLAVSNGVTPTTTTQPSSQIATTGHNVTFTAESATGTGQWQVSADGGASWGNLANNSNYSGVTTGTLAITDVTPVLNGYQYRFVTSGSTSNAVSLAVAAAFFPFPVGIAADGSGNLYVGDTSTDTVQKISSSGAVTLLAGSSGQTGTADGAGATARFNDPSGLSSASDGTLSVCDNANGTLRRITTGGMVSTLAGSTTARGNSDGNGAAATFSSPLAVCQDGSGNLYVADALNNTIRKITSAGAVSTLAGSAGLAGTADGIGNSARFNHPTGVAVDNAGNVYVADTMNNTIRKITAAGAVSTFAGLAGISGMQDGVGSGALFNNPGGLAVDYAGNVYLADTGNSTLRKIAPNGLVSTIAGLPGVAGLRDGIGSDAWFNQPKGLALDSAGMLYVADTGNAAIRKVTVAGVVSTLALSGGAATTSTPPASTGSNSDSVPSSSVASSNTTTSQQAASSGGSGGGGGGGAMDGLFVATLVLVGLLRWHLAKTRALFDSQ